MTNQNGGFRGATAEELREYSRVLQAYHDAFCEVMDIAERILERPDYKAGHFDFSSSDWAEVVAAAGRRDRARLDVMLAGLADPVPDLAEGEAGPSSAGCGRSE